MRGGGGARSILDKVASLVRQLVSKPQAVGLAITGQVNMQGQCWRLPNVPAFEGVVASARRGDFAGVKTVKAVGEALGWGLAFLQNLLDLNAIVLTGPLSSAFDLLEPAVREELRVRSFSPLLAEVPLLLSGLGDSAAVIGAAYLTRL